MGRKHKHEEHENHERWVISYADFITLLFAFFVVMYGMASMNEGKYKRYAASIKVAFKLFEKPKESDEINDLTIDTMGNAAPEEDDQNDASGEEYVEKKIRKEFQGFVNDNMLSMAEDQNWFKIELKSNMLFESGSAKLSPKAVVIIDKLAQLLKTNSNPIFIEGHTDDIPISTEFYPSNWELSSARAAAVVRELIEAGVNPEILAAVGYAAFMPKVANADDDAREENRRVVVAISKRPDLLSNSKKDKAKAKSKENAASGTNNSAKQQANSAKKPAAKSQRELFEQRMQNLMGDGDDGDDGDIVF